MTEYKRFNIDDFNAEGRILCGYAASFERVDKVGDIIEKGAFKKTIEEGNRIKVFLNHQEPIGKPMVMQEDAKGLYTESKISRTPRGDEVLELIKDGVIQEMSIAYETIKYNYDNAKSVRILKELKLYEYGPVFFPANEDAVISGIKSFTERIEKDKNIDGIQLSRMREELKSLIDAIDSMFNEPPKGTREPSCIDTRLEKLPEELLSRLANALRSN